MKSLLVLLCGAFVSGAWAATESSSTITLPDSEKESPEAQTHTTYENKVERAIGDKHFEEDKRITDLELRANAGSLNRYSLQFMYGYSGAPINDLGNTSRPNPNNLSGDYRTYMSGSANVRYRVDQQTGINFGTGMSFYEPWQAVTGQDQTRDRPSYKNYGVNNPTITADRTYKVGATQMSSKVYFSDITDAGYKATGEWASASFQQYAKWTVFQSRFILGMSMKADYFAYARGYNWGTLNPKTKKIENADGNAPKDWITFVPSVEYKITDNLNFNTNLGYQYYQSRKDNTLQHPFTTWRVGVGWALTHDIYINPYVNFYAETPALDTTNFAFNTTFSIF